MYIYEIDLLTGSSHAYGVIAYYGLGCLLRYVRKVEEKIGGRMLVRIYFN